MRRLIAVLLVSVPSIANAAEETKFEGFEVGARLGYQTPTGDFAKDAAMKDAFGGSALVGLDAGYRINRMFYAGVTGTWVPSTKYEPCPDCTIGGYRAGVLVRVHLAPELDPIDPYLALGVGIEQLTAEVKYYDSITKTNVSRSDTIKGWEWANLVAGADYRVTPNVLAGAFLGYSIAQFDKIGGAEIVDKAKHHWITLGVSGRYHF